MFLHYSQVNLDGVLSFRRRFSNYNPDPFPLRYDILIAPFWNEVSSYRGGNVFYRFTDDEYILNDVGMIIRDAFINDFSPTLVFIATWDKVEPSSYPYYGVSRNVNLLYDTILIMVFTLEKLLSSSCGQ